MDGMDLLKSKHWLMKFLLVLLELVSIIQTLDHQGLYNQSICVLTITLAASFTSSALCRKQ